MADSDLFCDASSGQVFPMGASRLNPLVVSYCFMKANVVAAILVIEATSYT